VFSRNLNDITERVPRAVEGVTGVAGGDLVLDGEVVAMADDGTPALFQDTASGAGVAEPFFFDVLHRDGEDLLDMPLIGRLERLAAVVGGHRMPGEVSVDPAVAQRVFAAAIDAGHEGVVVKAAGSAYEAGRRGAAWKKVKPVHTLDLVVLAVEYGSGRRAGLLSNIHLGALDDDGRPVMVGKTFKGMTDEMLAWQTARFRELEMSDDGRTVTVRPEQVVEVAVDGIQRSTRYPGGVALRFARVRRYRDDKPVTDCTSLSSLQKLPRSH